jgi:hypothetical protein
MRKVDKTKYLEEYARQVLISTYPEKYEEASLVDKPDIQNVAKSIGVEVTSALKQRLSYGIAQFSNLYGKPVDSITAKKKKQLRKHKVQLKSDGEGIIKFVIPEAFWGSANDTKEAYDKKLMKYNNGDFSVFEENNLFLFAEGEEEYEVQQLLSFIEKRENIECEFEFDYIYLYTYRELYTISTRSNIYDVLHIADEQKKKFEQKAIKVAQA